ncbi:MAG TPA: amino acid adenylation domain-containing protein, partial [Thiolapillus brandeum]|nr:amino acid adenylation domain-containing protein [Thiolapillus brandeum]
MKDEAAEEVISAAAVDGSMPLSPTQRRLWLAQQLEPGIAIYNISHATHIRGELSVPALKRALDKVVERHEILRTTVKLEGEEPQLVVADSLSIELPVVDLSCLPATDKEMQAQHLAGKEAHFDFDLSKGPLVRVLLLCLGEREHLLVLSMHHIIYDAWSRNLFGRELQYYYGTFLNGRMDELPRVAWSYREFILWQCRWLAGDEAKSQRHYWRERLSGAAALNLPSDRQQTDIPRQLGAEQRQRLPRQLTDTLKALADQHNATLFMVMLSVLQLLFHRLSGQEDILIGVPIAGRYRHPQLESVIGFFVNTLALRADLSAPSTFTQLLEQVRDSAYAAYSHSDLPYDEVVADLQPERRAGRDPLIDVMFNFNPTPLNYYFLEGTTTEPWPIADPVANYPLAFSVIPDERGLTLTLVYQQRLFSDEHIEELLRQYLLLLEQVAAEPEGSLYDYSLVTPEAESFLPDPSISQDEPDYPPVCQEFYASVQRTPYAIAISQGECRWTYAQLAERVEIIAGAMANKGLGRGDVVAVSGRRSPALIAAITAVLATGAVLLTIDMDLPAVRQWLMLEQSRAKGILLGPGGRKSDISADDLVLILDEEGRPLTDGPCLSPPLPDSRITGDDPAYIFFTSGTTGTPKAVLGCHKGLSHFLTWQRRKFAIGQGDRVAQLTSLSFDVLLRDIFLPLSCGATICLPEAVDEVNPLTFLERERITVLHTVPSLAQSWLNDIPVGLSLTDLRWVFFAGEPLTDTLVRRWREAFRGGGEVVNLYGATEATLAKCCYQPGIELEAGMQPAGWPLSQTQALVLNQNQRLCGIGEAGEIVLRTPFRTLGYLDSEPTERQPFVKNPFRKDAQDMLYFTGDKGHYGHDGMLEVIGRLDDQVKIRGIRVEPAEVTAALCSHGSVQEGVVVCSGEDAQGKQLIAYVVPIGKVEVAQLRAHLVDQLPAAMVPSIWVMLERLPLTSSG